jgi:hypothetical protein
MTKSIIPSRPNAEEAVANISTPQREIWEPKQLPPEEPDRDDKLKTILKRCRKSGRIFGYPKMVTAALLQLL